MPEHSLSRNEMAILAALQSDARQTNRALAQTVGLAASTTLDRTRDLERREVITGYHADVDLRALGRRLQAFVSVRVSPKSESVVDRIVDHLWAPVKIGLVAMISNVILNLLLIAEFKHVGLAMATSLSAFINAALLFTGLRRDGVFHFAEGWLRFLAQVGGASLLMAAFLYYAVPPMAWWLEAGFIIRLGTMLLICAAGAVIYGAALFGTGLRPRQLVR